MKLAAWNKETPGSWYSQFRRGKQVKHASLAHIYVHTCAFVHIISRHVCVFSVCSSVYKMVQVLISHSFPCLLLLLKRILCTYVSAAYIKLCEVVPLYFSLNLFLPWHIYSFALLQLLFFSVIQFSYIDTDGNPVDVVQMTFLKLLSATAKQDFTYTCQNSAGWFDSASDSYQHALRFRGSNDEELTQAKSPFISVVHDGCQVSAATRQREGLASRYEVVLMKL